MVNEIFPVNVSDSKRLRENPHGDAPKWLRPPASTVTPLGQRSGKNQLLAIDLRAVMTQSIGARAARCRAQERRSAMTKLASIIAALSLVAASSSAVASPSNPPGQDGANAELLAFCQDLLSEFPGLNLGECVSFNSVSDPGFRTKLCDFLLETGQLQDWGFESYDDCVRNI